MWKNHFLCCKDLCPESFCDKSCLTGLFAIGTFVSINTSCGNFGLILIRMYTLFSTQLWSSFFLGSSRSSLGEEIIIASLVWNSNTPCQKGSPCSINTFIKCLFLPVAFLPYFIFFPFWICVISQLTFTGLSWFMKHHFLWSGVLFRSCLGF